MNFARKNLPLSIAGAAVIILLLMVTGWLALARTTSGSVPAALPAGPAPAATAIVPAAAGNRGNILDRAATGSPVPAAPAAGSRRSPLATPDLRAGPPGGRQPANRGNTTGPVGAVTAQFVRPLLGARARAGEPITVTYNASAAAGLTSVQLWSDGSLYAGYSDSSATLKSLQRSQYWSSPVPGRHALTVVAHDAQGHTFGTVPVIVLVAGDPVPLMPAVRLVAPPAGARIPLGQSIPVTITASSPTGITRVEFWRDWGLAGVWQSPDSKGLEVAGFNLTWTAQLTGTYTIWASAYDLSGLKTATQPITVAVVLPATLVVQPSPTLTSPTLAPTIPPAPATAEPTLPVPMATFVPPPELNPSGPSPLPTPEPLLEPATETPPEDSSGPPAAEPQGQSVPTTEDNSESTSTPESP